MQDTSATEGGVEEFREAAEANVESLRQAVLEIPLHTWGLFLAIAVGLAVGFVLVNRFLKWRIGKWADHTATIWDDLVADMLGRTRWYFLTALAFVVATWIIDMPDAIEAFLGRLAVLTTLLQVLFWGNRAISFYVDRYKEQRLAEDAAAVTTMQAVGMLARLVLASAVLLMALENFGINVTALVAGLGIGGIAIALAAQNILGDLFASLSIVLDKPFVVGDFLIVNEFLGSVEHIGLKTTRLRSLGGEQIIFSNGDLLGARIRNYKRMYERRVLFSVGITYETPYALVEKVPEILREAVEAQDQTRFDRAHFKQYGDFSLVYETVYYVLAPDYNIYMDLQQAINLHIHRRFEEEDIDFAYPTQTLHINTKQTPAQAPEVAAGQ